MKLRGERTRRGQTPYQRTPRYDFATDYARSYERWNQDLRLRIFRNPKFALYRQFAQKFSSDFIRYALSRNQQHLIFETGILKRCTVNLERMSNLFVCDSLAVATDVKISKQTPNENDNVMLADLAQKCVYEKFSRQMFAKEVTGTVREGVLPNTDMGDNLENRDERILDFPKNVNSSTLHSSESNMNDFDNDNQIYSPRLNIFMDLTRFVYERIEQADYSTNVTWRKDAPMVVQSLIQNFSSAHTKCLNLAKTPNQTYSESDKRNEINASSISQKQSGTLNKAVPQNRCVYERLITPRTTRHFGTRNVELLKRGNEFQWQTSAAMFPTSNELSAHMDHTTISDNEDATDNQPECPTPNLLETQVSQAPLKSFGSTSVALSTTENQILVPSCSPQASKPVEVSRRETRSVSGRVRVNKEDYYKSKLLKGSESGLETKQTQTRGEGVFAAKDFKRSEYLVEYKGELIENAEATRRNNERAEKNPSEIENCYMFQFCWKNKTHWLDATDPMFGIGRLVNHANEKKANSKVKLIDVDGYPRLFLVATKAIRKGDEIRYDYGDRRSAIVKTYPFLSKKYVTPDSSQTSNHNLVSEK